MTDLILIRGLPGSGKSTLAKKFINYRHFEADMFFYSEGNGYNYNADLIKDAHKWCQDSTWACLSNKINVVVSNTFTRKRELKPYFTIAKEFGIIPTVITAEGNFGNIHNVPEDTIQKMKERFVYDISSLFEL